jgi:hypothetical protein
MAEGGGAGKGEIEQPVGKGRGVGGPEPAHVHHWSRRRPPRRLLGGQIRRVLRTACAAMGQSSPARPYACGEGVEAAAKAQDKHEECAPHR